MENKPFWEQTYGDKSVFTDTHPGGIHHEHAYERVIARKAG